MSFIININNNLTFNFLEKYNQNDLLDFLNFDKNNSNIVNIFNDINFINKFNFNYNLNDSSINILDEIIKEIETIYFFYRECSIYTNNFYVGKFKHGNYFLIKINYYNNTSITNATVFISNNYQFVIDDKNIFYSNDIILYENFNILKYINNSIIDIYLKKNILKKILHENINNIDFRLYLNNKIKENMFLEASNIYNN